jgi:hypothetical protein
MPLFERSIPMRWVDAALRLLSLDRCSIIRVCDANNSGHQEIQ